MTIELADQGLLRTEAFIDGRWVPSGSGATYPVDNPATRARIADVAHCDATDAAHAIDAASRALPAWRATTANARSALLVVWSRALLAHRDDLASLLSTEQGKPLVEAVGEIAYAAAYLQWFAEEAKRITGDVLPTLSGDARLFVLKQPVGVVACITPWNFPGAMLARKIAPALAAGCTVVCKPANETPLSANAMAELARRVGVPAGVVNIVSGDTQAIGAELTSNPVVRKLTFTGSTAVGRLLVAQCAPTLKRTSMELGGNAPFIVFESADLDAAVRGLVANKFRNAGQTCVCTNRVLVQRPVMAAFAEKLAAAVAVLRIGDAFDPDVAIGPLINAKAVAKVEDMLADARSKGATVTVAGDDRGLGGNFMSPRIVRDARPDMRLFTEEVFGPVVPLFAFETEVEAVALANDTPFGLAAYFYSRDLSQVFRVGEALEAGMVGANDATLSSEAIPFGGIKQSGHGREGSRYGLDDYLELKHLKIGGLA